VSSDKVDAHELKNYEEINENLAMIRSFQVLFRVTKIGVVSSHLYCFGQTD
jgi:hypothetical protein